MGHVVRMTMTGAAGITFVFLVDATNLFWVSLLGDARMVAAIGFAFAIQFFSVSSGIGLMIAATVLVSRAIGARRRDAGRRLAGSAIVVACLVQAAMAATIIAFRYDLLHLAGATGDTLDLAARYLLFTVPSLPIMVIGMVASGCLRAEGDGKRAMYVTLTSGGVAMFADPLLIYVLGLGLDGAALGLTLSRCVMMVTALIWATRVHDLIAWPDWRATLGDARPYFAVALPAILTQMATPFGNYVLTAVLAPFGDDAVAGWAVVGRLTVVAFGGIFSLAGAIGGIFGQNFGAGHHDRLVSTYRDAMIFCLVYTLVVWGLLVLTGDAVGRAFGLSPGGAEVLHAFTHVGAGAFLFSGAFFVSNAAFNALGRPTRSTALTWLRDGVLTWPVATWMASLAGAVGVIYAQAVLGALIGLVAGLWGWHFVRNIDPAKLQVEPGVRRGWRDPNSYRRR
ncbi:MAG: multidrug transporter MATE [Rhodobacteraceae bacterium]|nr:MAG: multidrug transporter MATE [Paracoccaceae bacterium]